MMKLLECIRILEKQKAAKIMYCQNRGLPIPTFDCAEDYWIPVEPVTAQQYAEIAHGRWVETGMVFIHSMYDLFTECSLCSFRHVRNEYQEPYRYCPNCGAKMDGGAEHA